MIGVFVFLQFLFYVFWEIMLIPMYPADTCQTIVRCHQICPVHHSRKAYSCWSDSCPIFTAGKSTGVYTFDLSKTMILLLNFIQLALLAFFLAFAIKVPMFPFHMRADAHTEAPTVGSVVLVAQILSKWAHMVSLDLPFRCFQTLSRTLWVARPAVIGICST